MENLKFSEQLIKGKITETIFEGMLRNAGGYTILPFGYENILPELVNGQFRIKSEEVNIIQRTPDFVVINDVTHEVFLIEVKFRKNLIEQNIQEEAEEIYALWKPAYLFIATLEGFYYGKVSNLVRNGGKIEPLKHEHIKKELQDKYLALLNKFLDS